MLSRLKSFTLIQLVVLVGVLFGPAFFAIDGFIQFSLDRVLLFSVIALVAARLVRGADTLPTFTRLDALIIALTAVCFVSAARFGLFEGEPPPVARWLFFMAFPLAGYLVTRVSRLEDGDVRRMIHGIIGLGVYLSVMAVCEIKGLHALVFPRFIVDPEVWEFYGRGRGPLLNPAGNGILMTTALAACTTRFFHSGRHAKALYGVLGLVCLAGVYATLTRSVWLGAVTAVALISLKYMPRWFRVLSLACVVLLAGAMAMGLKDQILNIKRDKNLSAAEAAKSIELRPLLALVAYEMFLDRPILGHGYGHYVDAAEPYHSIRRHGVPLEKVRPYIQHNVFLSQVADNGMVGLSLLVLVLISAGLSAWRLADSPPDRIQHRSAGHIAIGCLCGYTINGLFHEVGVIEMVHLTLFFSVGVTFNLLQQAKAIVEPRHARTRRTDAMPIATTINAPMPTTAP
ncbi:MAG: O-antigen ligase family protein [Planctomycetota bacterium]